VAETELKVVENKAEQGSHYNLPNEQIKKAESKIKIVQDKRKKIQKERNY
jgi:hypothetical protein